MDINDEEKQLCQQLRDQLSDLKVTDEFRIMDYNLVRFLRARNMDLGKSEIMFRKYIEWRLENDIDNALSWDISKELQDSVRYRITGFNLSGGLVICANMGEWDPHISHGRYEELMKVAFHELETLTQFTKYLTLKNKRFPKMVAILNLEGITFAHVSSVDWIRALITMLKAFEAYYPESLKHAFLINAPWAFSILWAIAKPFISNATHERLKFLGGDATSWKEEIAQFANEDQYLVSYGGSLPDNYEIVLENGEVKAKFESDTDNDKDTDTSDSIRTDANTGKCETTFKPNLIDSIDLD